MLVAFRQIDELASAATPTFGRPTTCWRRSSTVCCVHWLSKHQATVISCCVVAGTSRQQSASNNKGARSTSLLTQSSSWLGVGLHRLPIENDDLHKEKEKQRQSIKSEHKKTTKKTQKKSFHERNHVSVKLNDINNMYRSWLARVNNQDLIKLFGIRFQPAGFPDNERSHLVFFRGVCVFFVSQLARSLLCSLQSNLEIGWWWSWRGGKGKSWPV